MRCLQDKVCFMSENELKKRWEENSKRLMIELLSQSIDATKPAKDCNQALYRLIFLFQEYSDDFHKAWSEFKKENESNQTIIEKAEKFGIDTRITNNVMRRIFCLDDSIEQKMSASTNKAIDWARCTSIHAHPRVLMLLAVPPTKTGSGHVVAALAREHQKTNASIALSFADENPVSPESINLEDTALVDTILFGKHEFAEIDLPVPTFSADMPFKHVRYKDISLIEQIELLEVYYVHLDRLIEEYKPDIIHTTHLFLLNSLVSLIAPWIPVVCTSQGTEEKMLDEDSRMLPLVKNAAGKLDRILSISPDITSDIERIYDVDKSKISLVGNGVDLEIFQHRTKKIDRSSLLKQHGITDNYEKIVLFVGKFSAWKGIEYLINASKEYSYKDQKVLTLIMGNGTEKTLSHYRNQIEKLGLSENVHILPDWHEKEKIAAFMSISDVVVVPSVLEPFGMVVVEALASGCRVVASDCGGPKMIIDKKLVDHKLASLVGPIHPDQNSDEHESYVHRLAVGISDMLNRPPLTSEEKEMLFCAAKRYSWPVIYKKIAGIYRDVIRQRVERYHPDMRPAMIPQLSQKVRFVEVHPTNKCNLFKIACGSDCTYHGVHQNGEMLPFHAIEKIISMEPELVFVVGGGEPSLYQDKDKRLPQFISQLQRGLPKETKIVLCSNGFQYIDGDWQNCVDSLRISTHGLKASHFSGEPMPKYVERIWENIWKYFGGSIKDVWVTFLFDRSNALDALVIVEELWKKWDKMCREDVSLQSKNFGFKLLHLTDDEHDDPFHKSNPNQELQQKWKASIDKMNSSNRSFGNYLKSYSNNKKGNFIIPKEIVAGSIYEHQVPKCEYCLLALDSVLLASNSKMYPCCKQAARGGYHYGHIDKTSLEELTLARSKLFTHPLPGCRRTCRLLNTFIGEQIIKKSQPIFNSHRAEILGLEQNIQLLLFYLDDLETIENDNIIENMQIKMRQLSQKYRIAALTNKTKEDTFEILDSLKIKDLIGYVSYDSSVLEICNYYALADSEAVVVGLRKENDIYFNNVKDMIEMLESRLEEMEKEIASQKKEQKESLKKANEETKKEANEENPLASVEKMMHNASEYGVMTTGKWLASPSRVSLVAEGRYSDVMPINAQFVPSSICLCGCLACTYGRSKDEYRQKQKDGCFKKSEVIASLDDMKLMIDRLVESGVKGITFTGGGDLFLNPHTLDAVEYAVSLGAECALFNEAYLMTDEIADRMMQVGLRFTRISFNAGRAISYKYTFGLKEKDFYRALSNIEKLAAAKEKYKSDTFIGIGCLMSPISLTEQMEVARLIKGIEERHPGTIHNLWYRPTVRYDRGSQLTHPKTKECLDYVRQHPDLKKYYNAFHEFVYKGKQFPSWVFEKAMDDVITRIKPEMERGPHRIKIFYPRERILAMGEKDKGFAKCRACSWLTFVGPDGSVYHCVENGMDPRFIYGNLKENTMEEIWNSNRRKEIMEMADREGIECICPPQCMLTEYNRTFEVIAEAQKNPKYCSKVANIIKTESERFMKEYGHKIGGGVKFL